ncbi:MAG TPA: hypothetical protein QF621_07120 [Candidatus Thalassarchaeaceae archaeon]|nr:hypothetical protein [Candidatus Thalassarchaeaceae archaeon]
MPPFYPRAGGPWDDDEVDELLHWLQDGRNTYVFSLEHGRSHSSVILRVGLCYDENLIEINCHHELHPNRFQYIRDGTRWSEMEIDALIDELTKHLPIIDIADIHQRSPRAIKFALSILIDRRFVEVQIRNGGDE